MGVMVYIVNRTFLKSWWESIDFLMIFLDKTFAGYFSLTPTLTFPTSFSHLHLAHPALYITIPSTNTNQASILTMELFTLMTELFRGAIEAGSILLSLEEN